MENKKALLTAHQRHSHEHMYNTRRLENYFAARSKREDALFAMPRLCLGECDPRARARGVYVLSDARATRAATSGDAPS